MWWRRGRVQDHATPGPAYVEYQPGQELQCTPTVLVVAEDELYIPGSQGPLPGLTWLRMSTTAPYGPYALKGVEGFHKCNHVSVKSFLVSARSFRHGMSLSTPQPRAALGSARTGVAYYSDTRAWPIRGSSVAHRMSVPRLTKTTAPAASNTAA